MGIKIRAMRETDTKFIGDAWRASFRTARTMASVSDDVYFPEMLERITRLLATSITLVACDELDEDTIVGFCVCSANTEVLHYVYVKHDFRGLGVARLLTAGLPLRFTTHLSSRVRHLPPSLVYNPFLLEKS